MALTNPSTDQSNHAESSSAAAAVFKRLHPDSYLARYLAQGYRPDGRKINGWRDASINVGSIGTADGSALVRIGDTTIVCGIKAEISEPDALSPLHGYIIPNIDLPALSSPRFKPGPPGDEAQVYSRWLYDLITSSNVIDPSSLCISPGKSVWAIYIDVVCINYDGNAFDASVLAVMAALQNTRLPKATYEPTSNKTICKRNEKYPLKLGRIPLSASFGVFQSKYLLPDPSSFEHSLPSTTIMISLDEDDKACMIKQQGIGGMIGKNSMEVLEDVWEAAKIRCRELRKILEDIANST